MEISRKYVKRKREHKDEYRKYVNKKERMKMNRKYGEKELMKMRREYDKRKRDNEDE